MSGHWPYFVQIGWNIPVDIMLSVSQRAALPVFITRLKHEPCNHEHLCYTPVEHYPSLQAPLTPSTKERETHLTNDTIRWLSADLQLHLLAIFSSAMGCEVCLIHPSETIKVQFTRSRAVLWVLFLKKCLCVWFIWLDSNSYGTNLWLGNQNIEMRINRDNGF